jgi:hypothetical protein
MFAQALIPVYVSHAQMDITYTAICVIRSVQMGIILIKALKVLACQLGIKLKYLGL